ncbi:glycerol-3-phosphate dehydrogenase/oxidase [Martelella soudanensis]|uniref:glycerol-3-phosphate dehydrogenase/oxidase n=1 Tax=unclassified Martelella TaxID=2629616 RepID=UPI0015DEBD59|nr:MULTISPECIES: glycerol-3-phosphate dehydrogenase/oxidase [unclassified Martelella]
MSEDTAFDVVIIGAGVNGAGLFRDLSLQGVNCLITEKSDFGSGTSAAPSRLIHGGLKYLETGEFGLVAQSTLERNLLLLNAPHCVEPLPTMIPIFSWTKGIWAAIRTLFGSTSAPRSRGAILVKIGLALYDFYGARNRVMPRHKLVGRKRALRDMPGLTEAIVAAGTYYDARITQPERLVMELIKDGLAANPGSAAYNATTIREADAERIVFETEAGETFAVKPGLVVNAAGPWIDHVNAMLGMQTKLIGGTKGSHVLLRNDELVRRLAGRMIYFEADDGRICLVYEYLGLALAGSTDIPADNPDAVRCEDDEIGYFIASLKALLPGLEIGEEQIVYAYSGIRPLPASNADIPGLISRDHSAPVLEADDARHFAIIPLIGGKWTTFRGFAEEVADAILKRLGRNRRVSTEKSAIGGGRDFPVDKAARQNWIRDVARETGLSKNRIDELLSRYGTTARAIAAHEAGFASDERLPQASGYSAAEIDWIARNEFVVHLADIVMRRTTLAITGRLQTGDIERIADLAGGALGWSDETRAREVAAVEEHLRSVNRVRF